MEFKYLSIDMTMDEVKKAYRNFAKTLHPDLGGDEEEFKVLANEYAALERMATERNVLTLADIDAISDAKIQAIVNTLRELYPRTPVSIDYAFTLIEVTFQEKTSFKRMIDIEQIIRSFGFFTSVKCNFHLDGRKSPIQFYTIQRNEYYYTLINMTRGKSPDIDAYSDPVYSGRRYVLFQSTRFEECIDYKTNHVYILRRAPKLSLKELLRIGK